MSKIELTSLALHVAAIAGRSGYDVTDCDLAPRGHQPAWMMLHPTGAPVVDDDDHIRVAVRFRPTPNGTCDRLWVVLNDGDLTGELPLEATFDNLADVLALPLESIASDLTGHLLRTAAHGGAE